VIFFSRPVFLGGFGQVQSRVETRHEMFSLSVFEAATDIYLDFSKAFIF